MDWNLFWTAFGAIGGTIGALATTAAVIVALWQTKYTHKKKLKLKFDDNTKIMGGSGQLMADMVSMTVTNIGNREVIIDRWGFKLKDNKEIHIFSELSMENTSIYIREALRPKFPYKLALEESVTLYYEKALFLKIVPEYCEKKELNLNDKICFWVKDSTGQKYYVKTDKKAKDYCKQ